jgi:hypothetical protein
MLLQRLPGGGPPVWLPKGPADGGERPGSSAAADVAHFCTLMNIWALATPRQGRSQAAQLQTAASTVRVQRCRLACA